LRGFAAKPSSLQYAAGIVLNVLQVSHAVFVILRSVAEGIKQFYNNFATTIWWANPSFRVAS